MTRAEEEPVINISKTDLSALPFSYPGGKRPDAGGGEIETAVENIAPLADQYVLTHVDGEEDYRDALLGAVSLDENRIAHVTDDVSGVTTSLVAVRIQGHDAAVVPFELDGKELVMPLPGDTGSQIGFFIGHDGDNSLGVALRQGEYPGIPLFTAATVIKNRVEEAVYSLAGIKEEEHDEARWAEQLAVYDVLGVSPGRTRGLFSTAHRPDPNSLEANHKRLLAVPDHMRDLVDHHDAFEVTKGKLQLLTYVSDPNKVVQPRIRFSNLMYGSIDLGVGFGREYTQQHQSSSRLDPTGLVSAFQIRLGPKS